jgi:hypothetical protein
VALMPTEAKIPASVLGLTPVVTGALRRLAPRFCACPACSRRVCRGARPWWCAARTTRARREGSVR